MAFFSASSLPSWISDTSIETRGSDMLRLLRVEAERIILDPEP
jgi:hypothetical protein